MCYGTEANPNTIIPQYPALLDFNDFGSSSTRRTLIAASASSVWQVVGAVVVVDVVACTDAAVGTASGIISPLNILEHGVLSAVRSSAASANSSEAACSLLVEFNDVRIAAFSRFVRNLAWNEFSSPRQGVRMSP